MTYYPVDPRWDLQGIQFRANGTGSISVKVTVDGGEPVNTVQPDEFDETTLLARYDVTNVLLWKDTGWEPRFDSSPRFQRSFQTSNLLVYEVLP